MVSMQLCECVKSFLSSGWAGRHSGHPLHSFYTCSKCEMAVTQSCVELRGLSLTQQVERVLGQRDGDAAPEQAATAAAAESAKSLIRALKVLSAVEVSRVCEAAALMCFHELLIKMIKLSDGRSRTRVPVTVAAKSHFMEL